MTSNLRDSLDSSAAQSHRNARLLVTWGLAILLVPVALSAVVAQEAKPGSRPAAAPAGNAIPGKAFFAKVGCAGCHGELGEGSSGPRISPVSGRLPEFISFLRKPSSSMSPLSRSEASDAQVADIYAYLSSVAPKGAALASAQPAGNADNGKRLYVATACYACHGYVGQGGSAGTRLGPPPISFAAFVAALRHPREDMPPYTAKVLSDALVADIYAYVKTFPAPADLSTIPILKK